MKILLIIFFVFFCVIFAWSKVLLGVFKLSDAATKSLAYFREFSRAEKDQNDDENYDQFSESNAHCVPPCAKPEAILAL